MLRIAVRQGNSTPSQQRLLGLAQEVVAFIERKMSEADDAELEVALPTLVMFLIAANIANASAHGDAEPDPEELATTRERIMAEINAGWEFGLGPSHHEPEAEASGEPNDFAVCETCMSFARWDDEREIYHCKRCDEKWS